MAEAVAVSEKADGDEAPARVRRSRVRPRLPLALLVAAAAVLYATYSLLRIHTFRASTYDLVIFDQAIRSYSRFGLPVAMVKGVHNGFGPGFSILGDHFSPMLAVLAPLYWIHDGPETLVIAQAVLLALAFVPIWLYTERRLGSAAAYCVAGAYTLGWPIAEALAFDFHEVAFVPLLSALMVERHDAGRRGQAAFMAGMLLLVKEDMGLLLAGFGLYLLTRRGERRAGAIHVLVGLVATWVSSRVLISAFGGDDDYYWAYGSFGPDLPSAALHLLTHPWDAVKALGTPPMKLETMALLVLPLLLLPLASPLTLTAVPLLAERMLADRIPNWWEARYHYNAFLIAVLLLASVDGAVRLRRLLAGRSWPRALPRRLRRVSRLVPAVGLLVAAVVTVPYFSFGEFGDASFYRRNERARAAAAAAALVPDGALVEAVNPLGPALSTRTRVLLWDWEPRDAPWVIADTRRRQFPFGSRDEQIRRVEVLVAGGYRTLFQREGFIVLHRPGPEPVNIPQSDRKQVTRY
ncbi:DUF2079 domain-containing protein [Actinomadura rudentiformis]|uniref:DUF2079 domain-containing protein n=1 Tax=Actinomadura rudentiformis TaxID=359158 RepID=UPI00178C7427|nr:DUF2079 domain-containing protein [Actinomadura rudentiformis]